MPALRATPSAAPPSRDRDPDRERAAFRHVHGASVHGFALLLLLGDRPRAAALAEQALAAAGRRRDELRHPDRAATWMRRHIVRRAGRRVGTLDDDARLAVLDELGVTAPVLAGLTALDRGERAALVAGAIERIDEVGVGVIVGRTGPRLVKLLARARQRYLAAAAASADPESDVATTADRVGPTRTRVLAIAARALP